MRIYPATEERTIAMSLKKRKAVHEDTVALIIAIIIGAVVLFVTNLFLFGML